MIRLLYWENSSVWRDNKIKRKCVCVFKVVSVETPLNKPFLSHSVTNRPIMNTCLQKTKPNKTTIITLKIHNKHDTKMSTMKDATGTDWRTRRATLKESSTAGSVVQPTL